MFSQHHDARIELHSKFNSLLGFATALFDTCRWAIIVHIRRRGAHIDHVRFTIFPGEVLVGTIRISISIFGSSKNLVHDALSFVNLSIESTAGHALPLSNLDQGLSSWGSLAIDKAAGVTYKDNSILGRSFVLAKKHVKDTVVPVGFVDPVRIGGVTGRSGRRGRIRLGSSRDK